MKKNILIILILIIVVVLIATLGYGYYQKLTQETKNPIATMEIEGYGTIKLELYPDIAPQTVANFIALANRGYYDGKVFHRVVKDFMIQGGSDKEDATAGPKISDIKDDVPEEEDREYSIIGEFVANGYEKNTLSHTEGVISMARGDYSQLGSSLIEEGYNSADAQFFIVTKATSYLNGVYTAFGKVIEGLDIVHQIENVELTEPDTEAGETTSETPKEMPVINSIRVETFGIDYGLPETLEVFDYNNWLMQMYGVQF